MRISLIYLGRRGAGLPISLELTHWLSLTDEVLAVLSSTTAASEAWGERDVEILSIETYQNTLQAVWSWIESNRINRLAHQIASWKPDVLLFPMFYTWNPFLQSRLSQVPSVIAVHDPRPHPGLRDRVFQYLEDRSLQQASRSLIFSRSLVPELVKRGMPASKIDVISLGGFNYSHAEGENIFRTREGDQKPRTLLFFGRITAYKGLDVLLGAFKQLSKHLPIQLLIAGEGDLRPYRTLIESTTGIEVINRWIEEEELPVIFQKADVVILPYTSASQSGVIPIAASFGMPVIATKSGGIPEQIEDEHNGLLVESGSIDQLAAGIKRLLADASYAARLGQNLRADYEQKHSWKQITGDVRSSLEKSLNLRND